MAGAKKVIKKITAALAAAAAAVMCAAPASAAYLETERKAWDSFADFYGKEWDQLRGACVEEKSGSANITLEIGDALRAVAGMFNGMGMDFSWLDSIGLETAVSAQEGVVEAALGLLVNDTLLAGAEMPIDLKNNALAVRVPQISRDYLGVPFGFEDEESRQNWERLKDAMSPESLADLMPDGEAVAGLLKRYGDILFDSVAEEEAYEETVNVCNVEQSFTVYEGRISQENFFDVWRNMLTAARDDEQLREMIENLGTFSSQPSLYEEYQKSVDEQLDHLPDRGEPKDDGRGSYISSKIWMDENGRSAGREITLYDRGDKMSQLSWLGTEKNGNTGLRLLYDDGVQTLLFSGSGAAADGMLNGSYDLRVNGEPIIAVTVTDFDVTLEKGDIDGTYELRYAVDTGNMLFNSASLLVDVEKRAGEKKNNLEISLMMGNERFAALNIRTGGESDLMDEEQGAIYRMDDQEDMQAYISGVRMDTVLENCRKAGVPDEFLEQVTELVTGLMMPRRTETSDPKALQQKEKETEAVFRNN